MNVAFAGGSREAPSLVGKGFGTVRGGVADHNTDLKHSAYKNLYNFDPKLLQPITFETNGCPSKATTAFLAAVKTFVRNAGTTKQKNMVGTSLRRPSPSRRRRRSSARSAPPSWLTAGFARRARAARARERR